MGYKTIIRCSKATLEKMTSYSILKTYSDDTVLIEIISSEPLTDNIVEKFLTENKDDKSLYIEYISEDLINYRYVKDCEVCQSIAIMLSSNTETKLNKRHEIMFSEMRLCRD